MNDKEKKDFIERKKKERLALNVSMIRRSKGMSQAELAEKAGYETKAGIVAIENGSRLPGTGKRDVKDKDIANALDISLDQLWGRKRIELSEKGYPKMNDWERTGLTIFAPILKALSEEKRSLLIETALMCLEADGVVPDWEQTEFQKRQKDRYGD